MTNDFPDFHDGYFDGLWIGPNRSVQVFLRTVEQQSFVLDLQGVERLMLNNVKEGNILFDLIFRTSQELTHTDIENIYGIEPNSPQLAISLATAKENLLHVLEINPSYGAEGAVLFRSWKISPRNPHP